MRIGIGSIYVMLSPSSHNPALLINVGGNKIYAEALIHTPKWIKDSRQFAGIVAEEWKKDYQKRRSGKGVK